MASRPSRNFGLLLVVVAVICFVPLWVGAFMPSPTGTSTSVSASASPIIAGDKVTFTATVTATTGTPNGLVTFFDGPTPLGSSTLGVVGGNNVASYATSLLSAAGSPHFITATYQGDATHDSSTSSAATVIVNSRDSTTSVVLNPTTVVVGQSSTATVTLTDSSGSVPPGTADIFATTGAPGTGRTGFTATLTGEGLLLVAGGTDASNTVLQSAELYSTASNAFSSGGVGSLNTARTGAVAVLLPTGKVLIAGGSSDGTANGALNTAELFNPDGNTFSVAGSGSSNAMTAARFGATATLLNTGKVLIAGGENSGGVLKSAELYDPTTDTFTATGNLNTARTGHSATLLGTGEVLVAGGSSDGTANGSLNTAELFEPAGAGAFTAITGANSSLSAHRWQPETALLLSGKVLIAGGQDSGGALASADLYDPAAKTFSASSHSMSQVRANGSAVALPSGMVLLAGGTTNQTVDLYDSDSDQFNSTGSLQQSDSGLISTLLSNGDVLVVGLTTAATPASDAELYAPSFNPLGTVTFSSTENTDSFGPACVLTPSTSTTSTCTSSVTPSNIVASPHTITATYPADDVHSGSNNTASLTVNKADTTTTVTSSPNPSVFGQLITFTATVSPVAPGAGTRTGTVIFLDGGNPFTCTNGTTGTIISGVATCATSVLSVGNHIITTHYGGDANFNGNNSSLTGNPQVVNKDDTTTTITANTPNPSVVGQSVSISASVTANAPGSGTPAGTVTVSDGVGETCTITLSGGTGSCSLTPIAAGTDMLAATYGGDGNFNGSTSADVSQTVNKADTTTSVTSSQNSSTFGQSVTFTATVSAVPPGAGTPTGSVTFLDNGNPITTCTGPGTLSGGIATCTTSALTAGNHAITTSYSGDGNFKGSLGALTGNPQVVNQSSTTTTITSSAGTITLGDSVTFTATVGAVLPGSGTPTGIVTFFDGSTPLGSGALNQANPDQATFSTSLLAVGSHSITAIYDGDANFSASPLSSAITETVNLRTSTTAAALNPSTVVVGQSSTTTVTVTDGGSSTPPGTADSFTPTGAPATGRTAFTSTLFADGLVLVAGGTDANNTILNSAEIYSVSNGTFSSTGNLNAARTGAVAVLLPNGKVLVAGGSGDGTANGALKTAELFNPATGTFTSTSQNMTAARFGTTATLLNTGKVLIAGGENSGGVLNSAELYDPAADTFTASGNLNTARSGPSATLLGTGKVLVTGGSSDGTANGALNTAELFDPAGNSGAGTFASVAGAHPTLTTGRWQPEAALLLSGKVLVAGGQNSGGALANADLYDPVADSFTPSNHSMSQARANGSAVSLPNGMVLLAGGATSQAVDLYDADNDKFNTTGTLQQSDTGLVSTLLPNGDVLVVGLTAMPAADAELYAPSFNPLGTVAVTSSEANDSITGACVLTPSTSTASTCTSTVTPANVAASPHTIKGTYPADSLHSGSSNTASLIVNKDNTTTTITAHMPNPSVVNQPVTVSATVTANAPGAGTPTASVTVSDGVGETCTITLSSGSGSCSLSPQAQGTDTLTATYNGDANFNGSTSAGVSQTVNRRHTTTTVALNPSTVVVNQQSTVTVTVTDDDPDTVDKLSPTGVITVTSDSGGDGTPDTVGSPCTLSSSTTGISTCQVPVRPHGKGPNGGTHTVTASFTQTTVHSGGTGSAPLTVNTRHTQTGVVLSPPSVVVNQTSTATVTITDDDPDSADKLSPTGTVSVISDSGGSASPDTIMGTCSLIPGATGVSTCHVTVTPNGKGSGTHTIGTSYPTSDVHTASNNSPGTPLTVNTRHTKIAVGFSINPVKISTQLTVTATVTDDDPNGAPIAPAGTLNLSSREPTDSLDPTDPMGISHCTLSGSGASTTCTIKLTAPHVKGGSHIIDGIFLVTDQHTGSTTDPAVSVLTVQPARTSTVIPAGTTVQPSPSFTGQQLTFTSVVSNTDSVSGSTAAPVGTLQFLVDGNPTPIGTATINPSGATSSSATFTANLSQIGSIPAAGSAPVAHSVTTVFVPNADFVTSPSTDSIDVTLAPTMTNIPGQTIAPVTFPINPTGAAGNITFHCTVLLLNSASSSPNSPTCTLSPGNNGGVTVTLTTVPASSSMNIRGTSLQAANRPPVALYSLSTPLAVVLGLLLVGGAEKKHWSRRKLPSVLVTMLLLFLLIFAAGCGGGFSNPSNLQPLGNGTASGQYVIAVIGTDSAGNVVAVGAMQLTVQL